MCVARLGVKKKSATNVGMGIAGSVAAFAIKTSSSAMKIGQTLARCVYLVSPSGCATVPAGYDAWLIAMEQLSADANQIQPASSPYPGATKRSVPNCGPGNVHALSVAQARVARIAATKSTLHEIHKKAPLVLLYVACGGAS